MGNLKIINYQKNEEIEVYGGYMVLRKNSLYYLRTAGFPLMVVAEFDNLKALHAYVDKEEGRYLLQNQRELKRIRAYDKAVWWLK